MGGFIPTLGGLRGIAAMSVVLAHLALHAYLPPVPFLGGGAVGVVLFFALSGFLMTDRYLAQPATPERVLRFARSRFARVYPLYALVIILSGLGAFLGIHLLYPLDGDQVVYHLLLVEGDRVFWTISVEFQFYALFALFWLLMTWASAGTRTIVVVLIVMYLMLEVTGAPGERLSIVRNAQCFIAGMLAALAVKHVAFTKPAPIILAFFGGLIPVICGATVIWWGLDAEPVYRAVWLHITVAILLWAAVMAKEGVVSSFLRSEPMLALGEWSYGIYLLHIPIIWMGNRVAAAIGIDRVWLTPLVVAAVLIVARRSYLSFEVPMRILLKGRQSVAAAAKA